MKKNKSRIIASVLIAVLFVVSLFNGIPEKRVEPENPLITKADVLKTDLKSIAGGKKAATDEQAINSQDENNDQTDQKQEESSQEKEQKKIRKKRRQKKRIQRNRKKMKIVTGLIRNRQIRDKKRKRTTRVKRPAMRQ